MQQPPFSRPPFPPDGPGPSDDRPTDWREPTPSRWEHTQPPTTYSAMTPSPGAGELEYEDTSKVPAPRIAPSTTPGGSDGSAVSGPPARSGEGQPLSLAGQRHYADRMRSMANIDTGKLLALRVDPLPRPSGIAAALWRRPWVRTTLLVVGLVLLALRAGLASANFMAPGGGIIGWSHVSNAKSPFTPVTPAPTEHQLTASEYAAILTQQLSLDQEIGQMLFVEIRGRDPGPDEEQMINSQGAGGVLYFAYNIQSGSQVKASTSQIQKWAPIPLLISVDQEGGMVDRFKAIVGPQPSARQLAQQGPQAANAQGQKDAALLHQYGFNLNLAPVVDIGSANPQLVNPNYPQLGRTFGDDPQQVATLAGAYLSGLQADGTVTGTVKHYPGLGATTTDPHRGLPVLNRSRAQWEAVDLAPYRTLLATNDVRSIMVTHVMIPAVDPDLPSSLSPAIIDGTLRQELGFQGVVITDDVFNMAALSSRYPGPQAAVMAIEAGADEVIGPYSPQTVQETKDAIKQAMASGSLSQERIDLSVRRILTLKIEMGLIPLPKATSTPAASPSPTQKPKGDAPSGLAAYRAPEGTGAAR